MFFSPTLGRKTVELGSRTLSRFGVEDYKIYLVIRDHEITYQALCLVFYFYLETCPDNVAFCYNMNMQNFHYHFLKTNNELALIADDLRKIFDSTLEKVVSLTEEVETDIVVRHSPQGVILELGISGQYTNDARCIDVYLDLGNTHLKDHLETEVARTLIHEYMHVVREQYIPWENGTLLDSLIAEGLTQSFEIEVQPDLPPSIYANALTDAELVDLWSTAKAKLNQRGCLNDEWFFGGENIKRWSGYSLGFKLVQDKIRESRLKASELYKLSSNDFLPPRFVYSYRQSLGAFCNIQR